MHALVLLVVTGEAEAGAGVEDAAAVCVLQLLLDRRDAGAGLAPQDQGLEAQVAHLLLEDLGGLLDEIFGQRRRTHVKSPAEKLLHQQDALTLGLGPHGNRQAAQLLETHHEGHARDHHGKRKTKKHAVAGAQPGPPGPAHHGLAPQLIDVEVGQRIGSGGTGGAGSGGHVVQVVHRNGHDLVQHLEKIALVFLDQGQQRLLVEQRDLVLEFIEPGEFFRVQLGVLENARVKGRIGLEAPQHGSQPLELDFLHLGRTQQRLHFHVPVRPVLTHYRSPFAYCFLSNIFSKSTQLSSSSSSSTPASFMIFS